METKKCAYCNNILPINLFRKQGIYYYSYCKPCFLVYKRSTYQHVLLKIPEIEGEAWKWITGYEGKYQISNWGRVKSVKRKDDSVLQKSVPERLITPLKSLFGYFLVGITKDKKHKTFAVHRLVAKEFVNNPLKKRCVNHIDCDKLNNRAENLEWVTYSENQIHAYSNNLRNSNKGVKYGKRNPLKNNGNWGGKRIGSGGKKINQ